MTSFTLPFTVREQAGIGRRAQVVEQGVPAPRLSPDDVRGLGVLDATGRPHPGDVAIEALDGPTGTVSWLRVTLPVTLDARETAAFTIAPVQDPTPPLRVVREAETVGVVHPAYTLTVGTAGHIHLETSKGCVLDGPISFELIPDARTTVGPTTQLNFQEARSRWEIVERTAHRLHLRLSTVSLANQHRGQPWEVDPRRFFLGWLDLVCTAWSPEIALRWQIVSQVPTTVWLERYALVFPAATGSRVAMGDRSRGRGARAGKYRSWLATANGLGIAAAFADDLGPGAGILLDRAGRLLIGGIDPPIDGGFRGRVPDIHRDWRYGMARTFTGHLLPASGPEEAERLAVQSLAPLCLVVAPKHYSSCGVLPEAGDAVTFGPYRDAVERAMRWLLRHQWRGTLWWGEWWREWDVGRKQGIEEAGNGESATAPLYHFFRTGDPAALACARRAAYASADLLLCRRRDGAGPYVRSRRFLLDGLEWVHGRYQRVAGMMLGSHVCCDARMRAEVTDTLRAFAGTYVRDDGVILAPVNAATTESREGSIDMVNLAESLLYAYHDTGDAFFLAKAQAIGDWMVRTLAEPGWQPWNDNLTRYLCRGMLALTRETGRADFRDAFLTLERQTQQMPSANGHSTLYHCWLAAAAQRLSGDTTFLQRQQARTAAVLALQSADGGFPDSEFNLLNSEVYLRATEGKRTAWVRYYGSKSAVAYLPVLAARAAALTNAAAVGGSPGQTGVYPSQVNSRSSGHSGRRQCR